MTRKKSSDPSPIDQLPEELKQQLESLRGRSELLPEVLRLLTEPPAEEAKPKAGENPRVFLAGPYFGVPEEVRETVGSAPKEAGSKDRDSARGARAKIAEELRRRDEIARNQIAAVLRYDFIIDLSLWRAFSRWISVG